MKSAEEKAAVNESCIRKKASSALDREKRLKQ